MGNQTGSDTEFGPNQDSNNRSGRGSGSSSANRRRGSSKKRQSSPQKQNSGSSRSSSPVKPSETSSSKKKRGRDKKKKGSKSGDPSSSAKKKGSSKQLSSSSSSQDKKKSWRKNKKSKENRKNTGSENDNHGMETKSSSTRSSSKKSKRSSSKKHKKKHSRKKTTTPTGLDEIVGGLEDKDGSPFHEITENGSGDGGAGSKGEKDGGKIDPGGIEEAYMNGDIHGDDLPSIQPRPKRTDSYSVVIDTVDDDEAELRMDDDSGPVMPGIPSISPYLSSNNSGFINTDTSRLGVLPPATPGTLQIQQSGGSNSTAGGSIENELNLVMNVAVPQRRRAESIGSVSSVDESMSGFSMSSVLRSPPSIHSAYNGYSNQGVYVAGPMSPIRPPTLVKSRSMDAWEGRARAYSAEAPPTNKVSTPTMDGSSSGKAIRGASSTRRARAGSGIPTYHHQRKFKEFEDRFVMANPELSIFSDSEQSMSNFSSTASGFNGTPVGGGSGITIQAPVTMNPNGQPMMIDVGMKGVPSPFGNEHDDIDLGRCDTPPGRETSPTPSAGGHGMGTGGGPSNMMVIEEEKEVILPKATLEDAGTMERESRRKENTLTTPKRGGVSGYSSLNVSGDEDDSAMGGGPDHHRGGGSDMISDFEQSTDLGSHESVPPVLPDSPAADKKSHVKKGSTSHLDNSPNGHSTTSGENKLAPTTSVVSTASSVSSTLSLSSRGSSNKKKGHKKKSSSNAHKKSKKRHGSNSIKKGSSKTKSSSSPNHNASKKDSNTTNSNHSKKASNDSSSTTKSKRSNTKRHRKKNLKTNVPDWIVQQTNCHVVGDISDEFDIIQELGQGISSVVYSVERKRSTRTKKRRYALKKIKDKDVDDISFICEVKFLSKLKLPGIVKLLSTYADSNHFYILTELGHCDLFKRVKNSNGLFENDVSRIMRRLLKTLKVLHAHNIVHRDIKAENIIFTARHPNVPKLIDFADAIVIEDPHHVYSELIGTGCYLSPERWREHYGWELKSSDIWAIGILCYEILFSRRCFFGESLAVLRKKIMAGEWSYPSLSKSLKSKTARKRTNKSKRDLSESCCEFIESLLELDSKKRWTAETCLRHPFVNGNRAGCDIFDEMEIQTYYVKRRK